MQKAAIKVILGRKYTTYKDGLKFLKIDELCLSFAKECVKHEKVKDMFPLRKVEHQMKEEEKIESIKIQELTPIGTKNQPFHT